MTWDPLKLVLTSPANGYMLGRYTSIELTWSGPTFIQSPRAAFSFDGDFSNPAHIIYKQASRNNMDVYTPYTVYQTGRTKGYTTVYWRIEDPATAAFIEPSDANNMAIVQ